jgi:plasmid stabilization system protein ParE
VKPTLSLRPIAIREIQEAFRWYEQQRSGLGKRFSRAVGETLAAVESRPAQFARVRGEVRRALIRHFPYAILYIVEPDAIVVLGCFHSRRDPRHWHSRR